VLQIVNFKLEYLSSNNGYSSKLVAIVEKSECLLHSSLPPEHITYGHLL
jgi:hypothetical protein